MELKLGPRRAVSIDIADRIGTGPAPLTPEELADFEHLDQVYRAACGLLYNYVPMSGHPGGSISSGRFVQMLLFDALDYDLSDPWRADADIISYAAGHKALGLYAIWAIRNEIARLAAPDLVPENERDQLRLEDLLGFRRNPVTETPLFRRLRARPLDGHPTPATPFVRLSTGASGVGVASSLGLALGAADYYGADAPMVHIVEGDGGLTPGRVAEALAAAGTMSLANVVMHIDWNQASIDSNHVCRDGDAPGDYVQWDPVELFLVHDWNAIHVPDGTDFGQIAAAQRLAAEIDNGQPTAIVYRTTKGWQYGIEGRASHGAGHKLCSEGYYEALAPLTDKIKLALPKCDPGECRCHMGADAEVLEECFWEALLLLRKGLAAETRPVDSLAGRLRAARKRLEERGRAARADAPRLDAVFKAAEAGGQQVPAALALEPGATTTLRKELGRVLSYLNKASGGAILAAAADLLDSTSISEAKDGFAEGYFHCTANPGSRILSTGGICEDAMCGMLAGASTYGRHLGAGSSYAAFIAPLGHIASRLHAIGCQARQALTGDPYSPYVMVCAHAGLKTGEDGPTHADPQALQILQGAFPRGTMITLTPWDPREVWPLMCEALEQRPAVIAPFVTRPNEQVLDRKALGLAHAAAAAKGVYALRPAREQADVVVVLQGSGVTYAFIQDALPRLDAEGVDAAVYYVASAELFDFLPAEEQERIFPAAHAREAIGITGFTQPTMDRWITSPRGRAATLHPFRNGHFLGSGQASKVLQEAGLDGASQFEAIMAHVRGGALTGAAG
jgi:transketolase